MTPRRDERAESGLPVRLAQRVQSLGATVARLYPDGRMLAAGDLDALDRVLVGSPMVADAVRRHWPVLVERPVTPVEIMPGLRLAVLPAARRRRRPSDRFQPDVLVVLLPGPEIVRAEHLEKLCTSVGLRVRDVLGGVDPSHLISETEAYRMASMLSWMQEDAVEIDRRLVELRTLSGELSDSYEELSLLYKLSTSMRVSRAPDAFLADAVKELHAVSGLKWLALQLVHDEPRLQPWTGLSVVSGESQVDEQVIERIGRTLIARSACDDDPQVVERPEELGIPELSDASRDLLIVPIRNDQRLLGLLFGGEKIDGSHIATGDAKLCDSLASSITIFLENAMLYDDMQAMFLGTLHALTSAIDAKDSYTHGHSERVALLSRMIAQAAGLDGHTVERIYVSGLVHDVGKIGVPESVLCKPGPLNDEEFALIRMHPEIGARILEDIRQMQDLIPGVLHHHERWDGRGYPHGLAGNAIPIMGRVIGLADAFDAMSSNRTYRRALQTEQVLEEVSRCRGEQFDPDLVDVFLGLDFEPFKDMVAQHQSDRPRKKAG